MEITREEATKGYLEELGSFEALIRSIDDAAWTTPSRCEGWTVADVAAHVTGTLADIIAGHLDGLGTPEVTAREVEERRGRTTTELADELAGVTKSGADLLAVFDDSAWAAPAPGSYDGTTGQAVEALWYDVFLHGIDICEAIGRAPVVAPANVRVSIKHLTEVLERDGWGPATIAVDGVDEVRIGSGDGPRVTGDPMAFILAATGRGDPSAVGLDDTVNVYREQ